MLFAQPTLQQGNLLTPAHQALLDEQLRLCAAARALVPRASTPYFAHVRLATNARELDVLLGPQTHPTADVSMIDWQSAPLAEVFFACAEGESYELELGGRQVAGTVLRRTLVSFEGGELVDVIGATLAVSRRSGAWREVPVPRAPELPPRGPGAPRTSPGEVTLDPAQQRVVELPSRRAALVLGEAGCGKTTVALHRMAALKRAKPNLRCAVIVPTDGLRRLSELLLERLGVADAEAWTFDAWAAAQAHKCFKDLPKRESQGASANVIALKRHPALFAALEEIAARGPPPEGDDDAAASPKRGASVKRADLQLVFGDEVLMARVAAAAGDAVTAPAAAVRELAAHTSVQFTLTAEEQYAHVDADRLVTLDARAIDEGTPLEDAGTLDAEDYAVLFELDRLRARRRGARPAPVRSYDCLVIDEAQELAPLELRLLARAVAPKGTLVVAGDDGQQVDPTAAFAGWEVTMRELGARDPDTAFLATSYRCPPDVTALARSVLGRGAPPEAPVSYAFATFANECHREAALVEALRAATAADPSASLAVIARTRDGARRLARTLQHGVDARLALDGEFVFKPGVTVTCVQEVKGLEFDDVIVPDAGESGYPDTPHARRALYVALTRPTSRLLVTTAGAWTPLLLPPRPA